MVALSTYLGHAHVSDTYWYLQATPKLLGDVAAEVIDDTTGSSSDGILARIHSRPSRDERTDLRNVLLCFSAAGMFCSRPPKDNCITLKPSATFGDKKRLAATAGTEFVALLGIVGKSRTGRFRHRHEARFSKFALPN